MGATKDYIKAAEWYRKAADQGDVDAQYKLGLFYENGYGVAQNKEEAVKWYRKSAENGNASAQFNLGICYDNGEGRCV